MKTLAVILAVLGTLVMGCARATTREPSASPAINSKLACDRAGGEWHGLRGDCELP